MRRLKLIESIIGSLKALIKKPLVILPAILFALVVFAAGFLLQDALINFIVEVLLLGNLPEGPLLAFPLHIVAMYPIELAAIAFLLLLSIVMWIASAFFYARIANDTLAEKVSIGAAFSATLENASGIVWLGIFFGVISLFALGITWVLLALLGTNQLAGIAIAVVLMLLGLLMAYTFIKLSFTVYAMAVEKLKARDALAASYKFTAKRFWNIIVFMFVLSIIYGLIIGIGDIIDLAIPDENIGSIIFILFWGFGVSFTNLAMAFFYIKNALEKGS